MTNRSVSVIVATGDGWRGWNVARWRARRAAALLPDAADPACGATAPGG